MDIWQQKCGGRALEAGDRVFSSLVLQTIESQNMDYEGRVRAWSKQGRRGRKPRLRLWPRKEGELLRALLLLHILFKNNLRLRLIVTAG